MKRLISGQACKILAHRGARDCAPENTIAALKKASELGYQAVEFDVQVSKDHELVVIHDTELFELTGEAGVVCDLTLEELRQKDVGSHFSKEFKGERIPTLQEWLQCAIALNIGLNLELKMNHSKSFPAAQYERVLAGGVVSAVGALWPSDRPLPRISSFSFGALQHTIEEGYAGEIAVLGTRYKWRHLTWIKQLGACAYHVNHKRIKQRQVRRLKNAGCEVLAYTVNSPVDAQRFLEKGGDGFFTDRHELMARFS